MASLQDLKKYAVSENIFAQVVKPLFDSGNVANPDGLLDLLKSLHAQLWTKNKDRTPIGFSGAVGGNIQELLDGYRAAVVDGRRVQFGAVRGVGGDIVEIATEGGGRIASQIKTTASSTQSIREHIAKAAWQLTGTGGETPLATSRKRVMVVVQDSSRETETSGKTLAQMTVADWQREIKDALNEGHHHKDHSKSRDGAALFAAVDEVVIVTAAAKMVFNVPARPDLDLQHQGTTVPIKAHGFTFSGGRFNQHWVWLTKTYRPTAEAVAAYDFSFIQKHGIGAHPTKCPSELPKDTSL